MLPGNKQHAKTWQHPRNTDEDSRAAMENKKMQETYIASLAFAFEP